MTLRSQRTPDFFDGHVVKSAQAPGISIGEIHYPPECQRPNHVHERACFHFIFQGGYVEHNGRRSWECQRFTLAFQPPDYEHSYCSSVESTKVLTIEMEPAWMANLRDYAIKLDRPANSQGGSVSWLTAKLYRELHLMEPASSLVMEALALELAVETARQ